MVALRPAPHLRICLMTGSARFALSARMILNLSKSNLRQDRAGQDDLLFAYFVIQPDEVKIRCYFLPDIFF
jgi:hypothetical protein